MVALRPLDRVRGTLFGTPLRRIGGLAGILALLIAPSQAQASEAKQILERCGEGKSLSGFSQHAYREALKQMETELVEYSECQREIGEAERGLTGAGAGSGGGAGGPGSGSSSNTPIPLTPTESKAVESAHSHGQAPVRVGEAQIRPGIVHADIASAVNKLPHSLFAVLAFLIACALVLSASEARKRVHTRRNG